MDQSPAFLLLKPDCLAEGLADTVERAARDRGLRVMCRHRLRLTPAEVRFLWREYTDDRHPLTLGFLDRYLCSGPCEMVFLHGPDAFEASRQVKRTIRQRFAKGIFANVVHAAETRGEFFRQAELLLGRCARCRVPAQPVKEQSPPVLRPGALNFREMFDIPLVVDQMTARLALPSEAPRPVRISDKVAGAKDWGVFLGVDSDNSLDSAVAAVLHSIPGITIEDALLTTLYAGRSHGHMIAVGTGSDARICLGKLIACGIKNCMIREAGLSS